MILIRNRLTGLIIPGKFSAMCIWPFILIRPSGNIPDVSVIIRHESIHARQQLEMAWIFFFIWYILEFGFRLIATRNRMKAYQNLAHEREARLHEKDREYLVKRKPYAWVRYFLNEQ